MKGIAWQGWEARRDDKLFRMLDSDEPAWLTRQEINESDETVLFEVVHRWESHGWASRRFLYDVVGNVIHFRGTTPLDESDLVKLKPEQRIPHHDAAR